MCSRSLLQEQEPCCSAHDSVPVNFLSRAAQQLSLHCSATCAAGDIVLSDTSGAGGTVGFVTDTCCKDIDEALDRGLALLVLPVLRCSVTLLPATCLQLLDAYGWQQLMPGARDVCLH